eukprot:scaffold49658_cov30-Tisochrysis_lutea.AAC.1
MAHGKNCTPYTPPANSASDSPRNHLPNSFFVDISCIEGCRELSPHSTTRSSWSMPPNGARASALLRTVGFTPPAFPEEPSSTAASRG